MSIVNTAVMAAKNLMGSPAASDLGLGDQLQQDVANHLDQLRKKRQMLAGAMGGNQNMSQAALSPAALGLLGNGGAAYV